MSEFGGRLTRDHDFLKCWEERVSPPALRKNRSVAISIALSFKKSASALMRGPVVPIATFCGAIRRNLNHGVCLAAEDIL